MTSGDLPNLEGGCACGKLRYRMTGRPLFVHCCHCTRCQRETGSAFAVNALIESTRVERIRGDTQVIDTPSPSGKGQRIARCPDCRVAVWSYYSGMGETVSFVRVGTLDDPAACPPDIHIFTSTKQPWVALDPETPAVSEYYRLSEFWPHPSIERWNRLRR